MKLNLEDKDSTSESFSETEKLSVEEELAEDNDGNLSPDDTDKNLSEEEMLHVSEDKTESAETSSETTKLDIPNPLTNYQQAGLVQEIMELVGQGRLGVPSVLDSVCLPHTLMGRDVLVHASTKYADLVSLTVVDRTSKFKTNRSVTGPGPHALLVYPSDALASAAWQSFQKQFPKLSLSSIVLQDEESTEPSSEGSSLDLNEIDIVFATSLSLKNAYVKKLLALEGVDLCVGNDLENILFEGGIEDFEFLLNRLRNIQKIFISSKISSKIKELASTYLTHPEHLSVERKMATNPSVAHYALLCESPNKVKVLLGLLKDHAPQIALVFVNSKLSAAWLYHKLQENGLAAELFSNEVLPAKRASVMQQVAEGKIKVLVATDQVGRDLNQIEVSHVYNFDLPDDGETYLARMGQVGKEGKGSVYSLVCDEYGENYKFVQELLGDRAPKPVWPNEEYLKIVDPTGNPFLEKNIGFRKPRDFDDRERPAYREREERPRRESRDRVARESRGSEGFEEGRPFKKFSDQAESSDRPERKSKMERIERVGAIDKVGVGQKIERTDRFDSKKLTPKGPQIKPQSRKIMETQAATRGIEQRKIIPQAVVKRESLLKKILSFFLPKKKKKTGSNYKIR